MIYGHVPGVRLSEVFKGRNTMPCNMLHQNHMTGIHYPTWKDTESGKKNQTETVASPAIVMSGGYEDDEEMGDDEWSTGAALSAEAAALKGHDDAFWYTGDGGNDLLAGKSQIKDQHDERGNRALLRSQAMGIPVRVLRGRTPRVGVLVGVALVPLAVALVGVGLASADPLGGGDGELEVALDPLRLALSGAGLAATLYFLVRPNAAALACTALFTIVTTSSGLNGDAISIRPCRPCRHMED